MAGDSVKYFLVLLFGTLLWYQGCGSSVHTGKKSGSLGQLSSIFPYSEKSRYYDDVQLVSMEENNGIWEYQFIVAIVDAEDEDMNIDVEVKVTDLNDQLLCPRYISKINRTNNHIELPNCNRNEELTEIKVVLSAAPVGEERQLVRVHEFSL